MSQPFNDFLRAHLRTMLVLWLGLAALGGGDAASALTRTELYQATAPLNDRSENGQSAAFQSAMKTVLVRVTGARSAEEDPALAPLVTNARRYVQQYRAAADNQLWVSFDGAAIERWLTQNGQPLWGRDRPATFVWLGVAPGTVISAEDTSDLKATIDAAASMRGVPLIWPTTAQIQKNHVDYAAVSAASPSLLDLGRRLGGDGVLIGRAGAGVAGSTVRWTHNFQERSSEYSGTLEGVNRAADLYAGLFAASGGVVPIEIEVTGVTDLKAYAGVQTYLESLTSISHVSVEALNGDAVRFRVATRGGAESLQRALSLGGRLQPTTAGENGIQRFQLRR